MSEKVWLKIHIQDNRKVIALCDEDIIGKEYEEQEKVLSLSEIFYKGKLVDKEDALKLITSYDFESANIVGNNIVSYLLERQVIKNFKKIAGIMYAHIYDVRE